MFLDPTPALFRDMASEVSVGTRVISTVARSQPSPSLWAQQFLDFVAPHYIPMQGEYHLLDCGLVCGGPTLGLFVCNTIVEFVPEVFRSFKR